jgi:2-dehydropantoate 2-reductase
VDIEDAIAAEFPDNELLSALAFIGVGRIAPGEIHHQSAGSLVLGRFPHGITPAAEKLAESFVANGIGCKLVENVITARWQKAVWNAVFNPISIMGGVLDTATMLATEEARALVRKAMQEVCDIAAAAGHPQNPKLIEQMIAATHAMPAYKTSMALDYESRRPMEIEAILGNVVRAGRSVGASAPALETIYAIAKMVESKQRSA